MPLSFRIQTSLSKDEAVQRIRTNTTEVRNLLFSFGGKRKKVILSSFRDGRFGLRVRHRYSNGLTSLFDGTVVTNGKGCEIKGCFYVLPWVRAIVALIIVLVGVLASNSLFALTGESPHHFPLCTRDPVIWPATALALTVIFVGARVLGRRDEAQMTAFLHDLFKDS